MQGKHSWLHFVNYLIYTSIPLTIISCSQVTGDSLGTPIKNVFPSTFYCQGKENINVLPEDQQRLLNAMCKHPCEVKTENVSVQLPHNAQKTMSVSKAEVEEKL